MRFVNALNASLIPVFTSIDIPSQYYWTNGSYYVKYGKVVTVFIFARNLATTGNLVFTLPTGFRPYGDVFNVCMGGGDAAEGSIYIITDGSIYARGFGSGGFCRGSATFITKD